LRRVGRPSLSIFSVGLLMVLRKRNEAFFQVADAEILNEIKRDEKKNFLVVIAKDLDRIQ